MAVPPIQACEPATAIWDGSALLVIESGGTPCHPGAAAYYPTANQWVRMPTPPRATGQYPLAAWGAGRLVLVSQRTGFAAAWSPSARRWVGLPRVPATTVISLTWTGGQFLAITSRQAYQAAGRAWRLAGDRWRPLPGLPPVWHGWYAWAPAATVHGAVYVLAHELHGRSSKVNISGSSRLLRLTAGRWTALPLPRSAAQGRTLLLTAMDGRLLDPGRRRVTRPERRVDPAPGRPAARGRRLTGQTRTRVGQDAVPGLARAIRSRTRSRGSAGVR
ncbi:MAG: hypothetical protein ACYCO9_17170 [Streptosporangiaceae bacterium]